ncbi:thiamine pyrophosphate-binding protein [Pseudarthrobacter sp. J75]|uniref:thiamine pyrophosphate-binding protein n=1 Tax=unclassified Pseudarthrobacter TaxID=2647000 RepID=UPI002E823BF2|nr:MULTISPECIES: thiamine pyrophosphate-binding protein [unclassified Pseudarthrobacter]MEE2522422.1 thiamine pyrophosphate-binding protein [Pseudarthrobacter sp. J47]MEE2529247.1 thiamine pyrophosphate-binding protein [Pseudarthrobacter sp. J75]
MTESPNVSDVVADVCAQHTEAVFGLMGNGNAFFTSNLTSRGVPYVSARHEAGTVAMADAYYRASGRIALATVTYGAGFTNALTALTEAAKARTPMVLVVGEAPTIGPRPWDIDQLMVAQGLGVQTFTVSAGNAARVTADAWATASRERCPIIVSIPYDLSSEPAGPQEPAPAQPAAPRVAPKSADVEQVAALLNRAQRPLILAGNGAVISGAGAALVALGDKVGALFASSVMARSYLDTPWDLGIAGGFSRTAPLQLMRTADVVIVAGASLNAFQTRYGSLFADDAEVVQIDELGAATNPRVTRFVQSDVAEMAEALTAAVTPVAEGWRSRHPEVLLPSFREEQPADEFAADGRLNPRAVAQQLDALLPAERTIVQDGGHFCGWIPMYCQAPDPQGLMMVGTAFQSIGLGIPAAAGAAVARPERITVLVAGDGGALMALADLDSAVRTISSGVMVVFNDAAYGAEIHQYAARGLDDTAMQIPEVDFSAIGQAMGAHGVKMRSLADLQALKEWLAAGADGLFVLDVAITQSEVAEYMQESMAPILASLATA